MSKIKQQTKLVKELAFQHGFPLVGISKAEFMQPEAQQLESWLKQEAHGEMGWMENHFDKRVDPSKLVPGAKSVISLIYNYYSEVNMQEADYKIAMYALGKDYHKVIRKKLKGLVLDMQQSMGSFSGRVFVDSAPVLERDWAKRSGLGWIGKNTLLLNQKKGSYFFLAEIILDLDFEYDRAIKDHCGTCTRCIDACPTDAIAENGYWLDASKCISYLTIEYKGEMIPKVLEDKMEGWIFGCDICQQVCPWNRFSIPHTDVSLTPNPALLDMKKNDWIELTEEIFDAISQGSPLRRAKYKGLRRNIQANESMKE